MKPGALIAGKYRVARRLSEGDTALVFEAVHEALGQRVAVKVLPADAASSPEAALRFQREAQLAARIPGDHVARVTDFGVGEDGSLFIVFEYLQGRDLQQELDARGQLSLREGVDYLLQACAGVAEAHALGLVHRDIKPANLFLTTRRDGTALVKVLDFGVAKALNELSSTITGTGTALGTPAFAAPEQIKSFKDAGPRTDQYALAATLFTLLVGRPPFVQNTVPELIRDILGVAPPRPSALRSGLPAPIDAIVIRALAKRQDDRYPDLRAFAAAIAPFGSAASKSYVGVVERALGAQHQQAVVPTMDDDEVATVARPDASKLREEMKSRKSETRPRSIVAGEPIDLGLPPPATQKKAPAAPPSEDEAPTQVWGGSDGSKPDARLAELAAEDRAKRAQRVAPTLPDPSIGKAPGLALPPMPPPPAMLALPQRAAGAPPAGVAPSQPIARAPVKPTRMPARKRAKAASTAVTILLLVVCATLGAVVTYFLAGGNRPPAGQGK